jgi:DNA-binding MarR family transcriptional regulator
MKLFDETGIMAIGSRLRMLSERLTEDSRRIYEAYNVEIRPKWFPVIFLLNQDGPSSVTQLASDMGHSHPSVIKIVREMLTEGVLSEKQDPSDGRRMIIALSDKGKTLARKIQSPCNDAESALEQLFEKTTNNLWLALDEFEYLIDQASLYHRVIAQKKLRESSKVVLDSYSPKYRDIFRQLNEEWIIRYFKMEESDRRMLENPEEYIIDKGGEIIIALLENEPVGVCALIPLKDHEFDYELAKMAVAPMAQGNGIGYLLGEKIKDIAKSKGGKTLFLESNTILAPAIRLYEKLGFRKINSQRSCYSRCNIQMTVPLDE